MCGPEYFTTSYNEIKHSYDPEKAIERNKFKLIRNGAFINHYNLENNRSYFTNSSIEKKQFRNTTNKNRKKQDTNIDSCRVINHFITQNNYESCTSLNKKYNKVFNKSKTNKGIQYLGN
jgi:hypothetical protein